MKKWLASMERLGIPISWTTVAIGWSGVAWVGKVLTTREVIDYACGKDANATEEASVLHYTLAAARPDDEDVIRECLNGLSLAEGTDRGAETLKWYAILLREAMDDLPDDSVEGIIALKDFWASLDFPRAMPSEMAEFLAGDGESYDAALYRKLVDAHRVWLATRLARFRGDAM